MSICVAVGNKVMDTRLPQPVWCGDKYDVSDLSSGLLRRCTPRNDAERNNIAFKSLDVVRQYALKIFETAENGVDKVVSSCEKNPSVHRRYMNFLRQRKTALDAPLYAVSAGRSMIEMLGVLAIIGVLSVGGIAGYSKAMEKYKMNKVISEYSFMISGLLEHLNNLKQNSSDVPGTKIGLTDFAEAANIIPSTWKKASATSLIDSYGNGIIMYLGATQNDGKLLVLDFWLGEKDKSFDVKFCREFFYNVAYPLHPVVIHASMHRDEQGAIRAKTWRGDAYCDGSRKCLRDITLSDINSACHTCVNGKESCAVILWF